MSTKILNVIHLPHSAPLTSLIYHKEYMFLFLLVPLACFLKHTILLLNNQLLTNPVDQQFSTANMYCTGKEVKT